MDGSCVQHVNVQKEPWKFKQTGHFYEILLSFLVYVVKINVRFRRVIPNYRKKILLINICV